MLEQIVSLNKKFYDLKCQSAEVRYGVSLEAGAYCLRFENKQKLDNVDSNNNKFAVKLLEKYGNNSKFGKENLSYVRPYLIDNKSREIVAVEFLNSFVKNKLNKTFNRNNIGELICVDELKKANLSIGGLFFYSKLLKKVVVELESNNYKII